MDGYNKEFGHVRSEMLISHSSGDGKQAVGWIYECGTLGSGQNSKLETHRLIDNI